MSVPQTIKFKMRAHYMHVESPCGKPEYIDTMFESFEEMLQSYYKETHRRAYSDRATGAEYQQVLTAHGHEVITDDERRISHKDAIDGTWFKLGRRNRVVDSFSGLPVK